MEDVNKFSKEEASKWLKDIGLSTSGSKDELINKIKTYLRYPCLVEKLKTKACRNYTFPCSLDPLTVPPFTAKWVTDEKMYPKVSQSVFVKYASNKTQGSQGQQEKAFRLLQSRKIVSVKTILGDPGFVYVKAMIKKSYGNQSRPAFVLFKDNLPSQAHCNCPVGASGLCCHVLALLLFLKHFGDTGEQILELTCTQQLQKWHK